ncbi:MAG TPA: hypothetical protein VN944_05810, partial [Nitrospiria bacterium]|nr:hypothetical protein [Nitrospiria bacterium]
VLLMETLDTSFRKPEEVENELGVPVIATIPEFQEREMKKKGPFMADVKMIAKERLMDKRKLKGE